MLATNPSLHFYPGVVEKSSSIEQSTHSSKHERKMSTFSASEFVRSGAGLDESFGADVTTPVTLLSLILCVSMMMYMYPEESQLTPLTSCFSPRDRSGVC